MKCIILCMSCNIDYYTRYESLIRDTWGKPILEGKYSNLDLWFYTSSNYNSIDIDKHIIYVNQGDNYYNTFNKTINAFEVINKYFEYDFILRTNCTTIINAQLLSYFINNLPADNTCINYVYKMPKDFNFLSFCGLFMIFPKFMINWFIDNKNHNIITINNEQYIVSESNSSKLFLTTDDNALSYLYNLYFRVNNLNIMNYTLFIPCGYYKKVRNINIEWTSNYPEYFNINGKIDKGYNILNFDYYSKFLNIVCKEFQYYEYMEEYNLTIEDTQRTTYNNILELSEMFNTNSITDNKLHEILLHIFDCKYNMFLECFDAPSGLIRDKNDILSI